MNPLSKEIKTRKGWQEAHWSVPKNYPGARQALFGKYYSKRAYVPKTEEPDSDALVIYKCEWPAYSAASGGYTAYEWELWFNGEHVDSAGTMKELTEGLYWDLKAMVKAKKEAATSKYLKVVS